MSRASRSRAQPPWRTRSGRRARFGDRDKASEFDQLTRVAAVAVNGVLINHKKGMRTPLADGDTVAFVKAAAGG
ncbi:MAG: MoaD/ThiS family protein [Proteobacteria bacterium]|nr:MoaD/ThiS family protein [Pseudomonadota bacterium]